MTDDTPAQPPKRKPGARKPYSLNTNLSAEAGRLLDLLAQSKGLTRTAYLETTLRELARKEGITE